MKYGLLILLLIGFQRIYGNTIDGLKTDKQVERFIISTAPELSAQHFSIDNSAQISREMNCSPNTKWPLHNWNKLDINGDGKTDLLAYGHIDDYFLCAVIDQGNNNFRYIKIKTDEIFYECVLVEVIVKNQETVLVLHGKEVAGIDGVDKKVITDSLIYKFDEFINYNAHPGKFGITRISCYFSGGAFEPPHENMRLGDSITIDPIRKSAIRRALYYQKPTIQTIINLPDGYLQKLTGLLDYINIKKVPDYYTCNCFDAPIETYTFTFDDNSVKTITVQAESHLHSISYMQRLLGMVSKSIN